MEESGLRVHYLDGNIQKCTLECWSNSLHAHNSECAEDFVPAFRIQYRQRRAVAWMSIYKGKFRKFKMQYVSHCRSLEADGSRKSCDTIFSYPIMAFHHFVNFTICLVSSSICKQNTKIVDAEGTFPVLMEILIWDYIFGKYSEDWLVDGGQTYYFLLTIPSRYNNFHLSNFEYPSVLQESLLFLRSTKLCAWKPHPFWNGGR